MRRVCAFDVACRCCVIVAGDVYVRCLIAAALVQGLMAGLRWLGWACADLGGGPGPWGLLPTTAAAAAQPHAARFDLTLHDRCVCLLRCVVVLRSVRVHVACPWRIGTSLVKGVFVRNKLIMDDGLLDESMLECLVALWLRCLCRATWVTHFGKCEDSHFSRPSSFRFHFRFCSTSLLSTSPSGSCTSPDASNPGRCGVTTVLSLQH
jgi:hypothetical protein